MTITNCQMCHGPGKEALSDKFLTIHKRVLSGDSQASRVPETPARGPEVKATPGKDPETKAPSEPAKATGMIPSAGNGKATPTKAAPGPDCTACHSKPEFTKFFSATKHGTLQCSACHKGVTEVPKHMTGAAPVETASCRTCHKSVVTQGFHANVAKKYSCAQCHSGIHPKEYPSAGAKMKKAVPPPAGPAPSVANCTTCHTGPEFEKHFAQTGHGKLSCATCHTGITDLSLHMKKGQKPGLLSCSVCHGDISKKHTASAHTVRGKLSCLDCHGAAIHPKEGVKGGNGKEEGIASCVKCHNDKVKYVNRGHTAKAIEGNKDAPACITCHGTHDIKTFASTNKGVAEKRKFYTDLCITCHREGGVAGRYGVFPMAVTAYGETYHGKVRNLGYLDKVAGCTDCHLGHNILPADNPSSALNPEALVKTCGKCHTGFHKRFVSYAPHPIPDDPKRFLGLYLTKKFMIALMAGVFLFFLVHSLLWWRKAYAEKARLVKAGLRVKAELPDGEGKQYVRRFGIRERIMHVVLILSFFGVVISGFPIKYTGAPWARAFMTLLGGPEGAALMHRISAAAMVALFLYTCWLSLKFLFPGFKVKGWVGRLFGPDSLFPRWKDLEDCRGMFKWFVGAGEKPQFDRWTYWEKFDFMAVFWGMFVIGLSGVVMWVPELASYVMPGWMINIVHLAHSEEAFLAAVFIFTIHFFNNHIVPDKFPLEKNVFTGSYTLESLKHERPLEYQRILEENRLEEIKCKGPGTGTQLFAGVFGIASVLLGLTLTILIFWAVFAG